jgi:hypothetical protein
MLRRHRHRLRLHLQVLEFLELRVLAQVQNIQIRSDQLVDLKLSQFLSPQFFLRLLEFPFLPPLFVQQLVRKFFRSPLERNFDCLVIVTQQ